MIKINPMEYSRQIMEAIKTGVLLTTKRGSELNAMTISWGTMGIQWNRPLFIAFVRTHRHTRQMLDDSGEFTINIPMGEHDKRILSHCGTTSGSKGNKFETLGLTTTPPMNISTPGIKELPLTLECKILYSQLQEPLLLPSEIQDRFYPQDKPSDFSGSNKDAHIAYYGEIVGAYIAQ